MRLYPPAAVCKTVFLEDVLQAAFYLQTIGRKRQKTAENGRKQILRQKSKVSAVCDPTASFKAEAVRRASPFK